jgi:plastocyanin
VTRASLILPGIALVSVLCVVSVACSSGGGSSGGTVDTIRQGAGGFAFSPAALSVGTGDRLTIQNIGSTSHTFTIEDHGIDVENDAGRSKSVTIDLVPGTYQFICRFHASLGMRGIITVTG